MSTSRKRQHRSDVDRQSLASSSNHVSESLYIDNGDYNRVCEHCDALFWYDERIVATSSNRQLKYNHCCRGGRVKLPYPRISHPSLVELFDQREFLANICAYNYMFSMTSFGGKIDESINNGSAPYVFKIEGQIYHWLGSLCPTPNERPRFLQMYIYDTQNEISNRLHFFNDDTRLRLNIKTVTIILEVLESSNELVRLFRSARDLYYSSDVPSFSVRLYNSHNSLRYDNPGPGCIGAIVTDSDHESDSYDIVIRHKVTGPRRINTLHPLYMSLQYPLLFVHGESGWSLDLRLCGDSGAKDKNVTMNMFYSYQLHDRLNVYALLLRGGRLFQQYMVDA